MSGKKVLETDIHGYVEKRLHESDYSSYLDQMEEIESAASDYLLLESPEEIEGYEYHYITAVRIGWMALQGNQEYKKQSSAVFESLVNSGLNEETAMEYAERFGRFTIGNNMALVYSMAYELIEDLMDKLFRKIISEDVDQAVISTVRSQVGSYEGKQEVLSQAKVLSGEEADIVDGVKYIRDKLVHSVQSRFDLGHIDDLSYINKVRETINTLFEKVYEMKAYQFIDVSEE